MRVGLESDLTTFAGARMNGLDHVAILVSDLDAAVKLYRDVYGLELAEIEEVPSEKVRVAIFGHGQGRIELEIGRASCRERV